MTNKINISSLLISIDSLKQAIEIQDNKEFFQLTFFQESFEILQDIETQLHTLELHQLSLCNKRIEELVEAKAVLANAQKQALEIIDATPKKEIPSSSSENIPNIIDSESNFKDSKEDVLPEPKVESSKLIQNIKSEQPSISSKSIDTSSLSFNDILQKKSLADIRKALSLNDRFRFKRDLFAGDEAKMNQVLDILNNFSSYEESLHYITDELHWEKDDEAAADFIKMIEKRFL